MNKRKIGTFYEEAAISYLNNEGVVIIDRNVICGTLGELDLVGRDGGCLVFIECKYRKSNQFGYAAEAVNLTKQRTIRRCAEWYMKKNGINPELTFVRIDVIAIDGENINWIKNAF